MSEVKRFDHVNHAHVDDCEHIENPGGAWVKASDYDALAAEAQALREERDSQQRVAINAMEELVALRARVVVVPERDARRMDTEYPEGWNDCLDELARLNGLAVSESALDTLRKAASGEVKHLNNGHCPDDLEGHETRDPNCSVCRALIDTEKSK
ncbi:hypothetical protein N0426_13535 [Pseudomonas aeruginosa]|uniref:hypothetical protein n=1 Tax=Pseudomonas aeruginosa TaxID=287 RepID=UPI0004EF9F8C|nr:hypothetical protein [Pseudomonas aeruginosa]MCS8141491.1 hypothetical protein [Pseudomonas aeruginosa]CDO80867.1 unknown [Pseudomonas aeruginosa]